MAIPGSKPDLVSQRTGASHVPAVDPGDAAGTIVDMPPPPELTDAAKQIWDITIPSLIQAKVLRPEDVPLLIEFAEAMASARAFRHELKVEEDTYGLGSIEAKRLRTGYIQMLKVATSLASEFGISPVARVRLGLMRAGGASLLGIIGDQDQT